MTNRDIFYKDLDALDLTELQKIDIKILAIEYAHKEYLLGMNNQAKTTQEFIETYRKY